MYRRYILFHKNEDVEKNETDINQEHELRKILTREKGKE